MLASGKVFKYGDNIDTDVIIPARYLNTPDEKELASHCMEDIDKTFVEKVEEGDIIEYQMEGYTIIHRIKNKNQKNGQFIFRTTGDNNDSEDSEPVSEEQLIGKVIFKIRFLGYPAIWIHNLSVQEQVEVNIGN